MDERSLAQSAKTNPVAVLLVCCIVILSVAIAWLLYRVEDLSDKQAALTAATKVDKKTPGPTNSGWNTMVKSGSGGFQVTLPDGWGPVINDISSDYLLLPGTKQPEVAAGNKVAVSEVKGYGSDNSSVFSIVLLDKGQAAPPRGGVEAITVGKAEATIKGTKCTHIYAKDELAGIGQLRLQGDRDYEYVLPLDDKELHVYYSVYGSDPRNLIETVDQIVQTITLSKQSPASL